MQILTYDELTLISGGVDKDSEAYKIGHAIGEALDKAAVAIATGIAILAAAASGSAS